MADTDVTVEITDNTLRVTTPYSPDFPRAARNLGGNFDGKSGRRGVWEFDVRDEERVRALCRRIYGTDGSAVEMVTVRLDVEEFDGRSDAVWFAGRRVLWRPERDAAVRLGPSVVLIEGSFDGSGGSRARPTISAKDGTVVEVRDVPAGHEDLKYAGVTVVDEPAVDRADLLAERDRLRERLVEIDALLNES